MRYIWRCTGNPTFKVGDRVRITRQPYFFSEKLLGLVGTVLSTLYDDQIIEVSLDDCKNPSTLSGCYYFSESNLEYINEHKDKN